MVIRSAGDGALIAQLAAGFIVVVGAIADVVTAVIGVATIYAFFRYKNRISAALRLLRLNHMNDRKEEIKKTLDLISDMPFEKKTAKDVRSLFGRLNGQLAPLCEVVPELRAVQVTIEEIALSNGKLTEPIKQHLVHTVHARFESARFKTLGQAAGEKE